MAAAAANPKEAVCVTGANGFISSWLVRTLLEQGYTTIHASIYPSSDPTHLFSLPGATSPLVHLHVHEADVLDPDAILKAVEGCHGIFHVASPCSLDDPKDPETEHVRPAVQGMLNVLEAARKAKVRRVVLTSSISAMVPNPNWDHETQGPFDKSSWTDLECCKDQQKWYPVSKTLAEKAAWEYFGETRYRCRGDQPIHLFRAFAATQFECELCRAAAIVAGLERYSGVSLVGSCSCSRCC